MSTKSKLKIGLIVVLGVFVGLIVLAMIAGPTPKPAARSDPALAPSPSPAAVPSRVVPPNAIAARMTKVSPTLRIPWPDDAKPMADEKRGAITRIATVSETTAFYEGWMAAHGWTFDRKHSTMDPDQGVSNSLGYTTTQIWCKHTSPITTVSIIVGSGDKRDHGKYAEIIVQNLPNEDSCP